jgi:hypothetical protein
VIRKVSSGFFRPSKTRGTIAKHSIRLKRQSLNRFRDIIYICLIFRFSPKKEDL